MNGKELKARREALGLTQKRLAELTGYSENYIWMLENERANISKAKKLDIAISNLEIQKKSS